MLRLLPAFDIDSTQALFIIMYLSVAQTAPSPTFFITKDTITRMSNDKHILIYDDDMGLGVIEEKYLTMTPHVTNVFDTKDLSQIVWIYQPAVVHLAATTTDSSRYLPISAASPDSTGFWCPMWVHGQPSRPAGNKEWWSPMSNLMELTIPHPCFSHSQLQGK